MDFCILSPIAGLQKYSKLSRRHLVLPHLLTNPQYADFYLTRRKAHDFIILDNGAWEGEYSPFALLEGIRLLNPHVVVLPDQYLGMPEASSRLSLEFLDKYYHSFPNQRWGFCPQANPGDIMGWVGGLSRAMQDERISWFMLPRALALHITQDPVVRVNICRFLKRRNKSVHALGMLSGQVSELKLLADAGCDSIDSNAPVWRGWNGYRIDNPEWPHIKVNYDSPLYPSMHEQILENLEACGVDIHVGAGDDLRSEEGVGGKNR